jgi:uncharacterized protein
MRGLTAVQAAQQEQNRREYGEGYGRLRWLDAAGAAAATAARHALLESLAGRVEIGCKGTKLDCRNLAPGCRRCVEGSWSCLFVNGRCNCDCFYCPTDQQSLGLPTTNTVEFRTPADYVAYLERYGFRGASLSGGEPLLTPGRTLGFLRAIKERFGAAIHLWLYTNGTLLTRELVAELAAAGLDEIRFDIGATGYSLKQAALAAGVIPCLTVEIPAIPEERELLQSKLAEMRQLGVHHLNLHQLRLTPYNFPKLAGRGYTFVHGEKVTVLESELTALQLIHYGLEQGIELPINYCSFVYKNRFQKVAARRRNAAFVRKPTEDFTENGHLRALTLLGSSETLAAQAECFRAAGAAPEAWALGGERLAFAAALWPLIDFSGVRLQIGYSEAAQLPAVSYRNFFVEIKLPSGQKLVVEKRKASRELLLEGEAVARFAATYLTGSPTLAAPAPELADFAPFEEIPAGLQGYF